MKVVFDTNVFVSALTLPRGSAARALDRVVRGGHQLCISKPIVDELLRVLARKFARDREELARVAVFLSDLGVLIRPTHRVRVLEDPADDRVLECALAGRADAIVTGDKAMLRLGTHGGVRIITLRGFLEIS